MRSTEEKGCCIHGSSTTTQDISISSSTGSACVFEFHKGNGASRASRHRTGFGKPTPSKWDDAQKWLVGFSMKGGDKSQSKTKPRNSNADDTRLIAPVPQKEQQLDSNSEEEDEDGYRSTNPCPVSPASIRNEAVELTKKVDREDSSFWHITKHVVDNNAATAMRSICVRDMGTEMTPIASQEPSRTATPIRATTPAARSPVSSGSSTPVRFQPGKVEGCYQAGLAVADGRRGGGTRQRGEEPAGNFRPISASNSGNLEQGRGGIGKITPLESRAVAWDEAERAKYTARYKREEVKIQAWENHEKRKAEMEMRRMEVKAERLKSRAQERAANKLASTRRIAEERRANAEVKLNEKAARTSERADYIKRTGHLPSSFSFKLPSLCW